MTRYSIEPKEQTFRKGYGFLSFAKKIRKSICQSISESLSGK